MSNAIYKNIKNEQYKNIISWQTIPLPKKRWITRNQIKKNVTENNRFSTVIKNILPKCKIIIWGPILLFFLEKVASILTWHQKESL